VAALILILRSNRAERTAAEPKDGIAVPAASGESETGPGDTPPELLLAWVQFLKADIISVVNTLNNRLNVISHTVSDLAMGNLSPEKREALERIRRESERAAKLASGLLHRVNSIAPDAPPPVLFEYDGSTLPPGRILLVENDEGNQTVISKVFRRLGQEVTVVSNGYEAFAVMETVDPDCIISDVRLPYLDGRTLFEQVEQQKPHLASRFVFVTGDYTNPATIDFLKTTGQPYISKPYEMESLLGAVVAILRGKISDRSRTAV
jgi:CheY-like chemotaxis protein